MRLAPTGRLSFERKNIPWPKSMPSLPSAISPFSAAKGMQGHTYERLASLRGKYGKTGISWASRHGRCKQTRVRKLCCQLRLPPSGTLAASRRLAGFQRATLLPASRKTPGTNQGRKLPSQHLAHLLSTLQRACAGFNLQHVTSESESCPSPRGILRGGCEKT